MQTTAIRYTYKDYLRLPDDGKRYEIIEGELHMTPAPAVFHQIILLNVEDQLRNFLRKHGGGIVLVSPVDVVLSDVDVVEPDIIVVTREREFIIKEKNIQGPPDIVVEILSEGTRHTDRTRKRALYQKFGVKEYWMIDPESKTVEILILESGIYVSLETSGTVRSRVLRDFALNMEATFKRSLS